MNLEEIVMREEEEIGRLVGVEIGMAEDLMTVVVREGEGWVTGGQVRALMRIGDKPKRY
jgi:hypothetical protein